MNRQAGRDAGNVLKWHKGDTVSWSRLVGNNQPRFSERGGRGGEGNVGSEDDLSPRDLRAAFRAWFAEFDAQEWDRQFEADVAAGRLDWLIEEAREDLKAGRCTDR